MSMYNEQSETSNQARIRARPWPRPGARGGAAIRALTLAAAVAPAPAPRTAAAQGMTVVQRRFDPGRNGAWTLLDLGSTNDNLRAFDPRGVAVGPEGEIYVLAKRPLQGPSQGSAIWRVDRGTLELQGTELPVDADGLLAHRTGLYVGTKGTPAMRKGEVYRLQDGRWLPLTGPGTGAEVRAITFHGDALHFGTNNDGVYRLAGGGIARVGAQQVVQEGGFSWARLGEWSAETERAAIAPNGDVYALGKDLRVRRFTGGQWSDLGNVAEAMYDATGALVSFAREPKAIALSGGDLLVGTKGGPMSAEGRDVGAVFRWDGMAWTRLGAGNQLRNEVKALVPLPGGRVLAGTKEAGVWLWDGATWTQRSMGLLSDAGKIKVEILAAAPDGRLLVATKNTLFQSTNEGQTWTEVGFLAMGEEIRAVAVSPTGSIVVGAKLGDGTGAVFAFTGSQARQLGGDLTREARGLAYAADGTLLAALGGNSGLFRLVGGQWQSAVGNLAGDAADFKQILVAGPRLIGATKSGIQEGRFAERVETWQGALILREIRSLWTVGGRLFAGVKVGGIYRLGPGEGVDGQAWERVDMGLPEVETEGMALGAGELFALGKKLLYRAALPTTPEEPIRFAPLGTNPGQARLDGDGRLVFTGETDFKAAVAHGGVVYAGTKDGLFASGNGGTSWTLVNGPAEVKALALAGSKLVAAWKGDVYPDPAGMPAVVVGVAGVAVLDLAAAAGMADLPGMPGTMPGAMAGMTGGQGGAPGAGSPSGMGGGAMTDPGPMPGPIKVDRGGCAMAGRSSPGGLGLLALLLLGTAAVRAARPNRALRVTRKLHSWFGIALGLLIVVEAVTAIYLTHEESIEPGAAQVMVGRRWLPSGYPPARGDGAPYALAYALAGGERWVGTNLGLVVERDGGPAPRPRGLPEGQPVQALLADDDGSAVWVGAGKLGLYRCVRPADAVMDGATAAPECARVGKLREVKGLARAADGALIVAAHKDGLLRLDPRTPDDEPRPLALAGALGEGAPGGGMGAPAAVPLGKVLKDLHTGKLFGGRLFAVYDLVAVALVGFVGTGLYVWAAPLLRRAGKRKEQRAASAARAANADGTGAPPPAPAPTRSAS